MLLTKLHIPSAGNNIIHRTGLYDKLNEGLSRKLILVSAPAGFGKTTMVTDWIEQNNIPAAWFSIDNGDNDPVDFLSYIISGIQGIHAAFGQNALKLLNSPNKPSNESIVSLLINEIISIRKHFLLVLDDFHWIENSEILQLITYFLTHIPGNIHIAILTRSDPALPVSRLRSQHQLAEIRSADLSFSANDISVLFNKKLKQELSIDDACSLEAKTEGWIAGLQLTALSMIGHVDISGFIRNLKGDNRYIMDYLMEEVLKVQPDEIKAFLLQTSVLEQMSAPLCNAVLNRNDSQLILEQLEKNNMFVIPLDHERTWYRYHHLFAELLKHRLQLPDKGTVSTLHQRACDWFEQHNMVDFAITHALAVRNHEKSLQLIGGVVRQMWEKGQHAAILKYGEALPDEIKKENAGFCLYYSWILIASGQVQKAEAFLRSAEEKTRKLIDQELSSAEVNRDARKQLGKILVAFAYLYSITADSEKTFSCGKAAMENLSEEDPFWLSWGWYFFGIAYYATGDIEKSFEAFIKAFGYGKKTGNLYLLSTIILQLADTEQQLGHYKSAYDKCTELLEWIRDKGYGEITKTDWTYTGVYLALGYANYIWAETDKAYENVKAAFSLCKKGGDKMLEASVLVLYSVVLFERGDILGSGKKILEVEDILKHNEVSPFITYSLAAWKLLRLLRLRQFDEADQVVKNYGLAAENDISYINESAYTVYARLLLAESRLSEAESVLSRLLPIIEEGKRIERLIDLKISYALLFKAQAKSHSALTSLKEALALAEGENLVSFFLFSIDDIGDLLEEIGKMRNSKSHDTIRFLANLKRAVEKRNKRNKTSFEAGLSKRELDALKLMAENLTNQEIADTLFVSLQTVKTHVKKILLKLEVNSRTQAVTKAKELGII